MTGGPGLPDFLVLSGGDIDLPLPPFSLSGARAALCSIFPASAVTLQLQLAL